MLLFGDCPYLKHHVFLNGGNTFYMSMMVVLRKPAGADSYYLHSRIVISFDEKLPETRVSSIRLILQSSPKKHYSLRSI